MIFKPVTGNWLALLRNGLGEGKAAYTTSTVPKMKAYAPATDYGYVHHGQHQKPEKAIRGDFVAVYVAIGMISLSTGLGLHTAWQQLRNSPGVHLKKQRRETLPEVVEPDHVMEETDKFIKKSFFRKVAHVQDKSYPDSIGRDIFTYTPRAETLKSVGIDPSHV